MSRLLATIFVSVVTITPLAAQAFGIPGIPGMGSKSDSGSTADLSASQDQLVKQYVSAGQSVLSGNEKMASAIGLADKAAAIRSTGDNLKEGATTGALKDSDAATSEVSAAITEKMKDSNVVMDGSAKIQFAAGVLDLAQGVGKYVGMKNSLASFQSGLSSASPMMMAKLQSGAYIVSSLPSNAKNLSESLNNAVKFAKSHDVTISEDQINDALNTSSK